jgi:hypothetical protein
MTTLPQFTTTQVGPRPVLLQIEDQYNKRIDDDVAKLVDCFTDIVKVGEVKTQKTSAPCLVIEHSICIRIKTKTSSKLLKKDIK